MDDGVVQSQRAHWAEAGVPKQSPAHLSDYARSRIEADGSPSLRVNERIAAGCRTQPRERLRRHLHWSLPLPEEQELSLPV